MTLRFLAVLVAGLALCATALAADPVAKNPDKVEAILDALFKQEVDFGAVSVNDIPLFELLHKLSAQHAVTFNINEECFRGNERGDIKEAKPRVAATQVR